MPRYHDTIDGRALAATKLKIEVARLAKLEGGLPQTEPETMRYADLPPICEEDQIELQMRFSVLARGQDALIYTAMEHCAVEEWRAMSAWMNGERVGQAYHGTPPLWHWKGITENARPIFEDDSLCDAFIEAVLGGRIDDYMREVAAQL